MTIDAIELRLGNLLQDREGRLCKVEEITSERDEYEEDEDEGGFSASAIKGPMTGLPHKPITLNEDWLTRMGVINKRLPNPRFEIFRLGPHYNITTEGREENQVFLCSVQYIHQFQNIYFALTGEELEINLKGL